MAGFLRRCLEFENGQELHGLIRQLLLLGDESPGPQHRVTEAVARMGVVGDAHVVQDGQIGKEPDVLERPRDTHACDLVWLQTIYTPIIENNLTRGYRDEPRDEVEYRGLSRAIGSDQAPQCPAWQGQTQAFDRAQTAEEFRHLSNPLPGYNVNGELTLGENIADNSGLAIAYKAYKLSLDGKEAPVIDGLTGEQRFYLGFGQVWRAKVRDNAAIVRIKTDPHSPPQFRGNGTVKNQPGFYSAFGVKEGDAMYLPPEQRVLMW